MSKSKRVFNSKRKKYLNTKINSVSSSYCIAIFPLYFLVWLLWGLLLYHQSLNPDRALLHSIEERLMERENSFSRTMVQASSPKLSKVRLCCAQARGFWGKAFWPGRMWAAWQGSPPPGADTLAGCWVSGDIFWQSCKVKLLRCLKTPWCVFLVIPWGHRFPPESAHKSLFRAAAFSELRWRGNHS